MANTTYFTIFPSIIAKEDKTEPAVALDLGRCRFAVIVDTFGNLKVIEGDILEDYCERAGKDEASFHSLNWYISLVCVKLATEWKERGIRFVYVGNCGGDYFKLCGSKEDDPLYRFEVHKRFVQALRECCEDFGMEFIVADESYTSKASALSNDDIPSYGDDVDDEVCFHGTRINGSYIVDQHITINADVNGAINILRKEGHSIVLKPSSKIFDYISVVF